MHLSDTTNPFEFAPPTLLRGADNAAIVDVARSLQSIVPWMRAYAAFVSLAVLLWIAAATLSAAANYLRDEQFGSPRTVAVVLVAILFILVWPGYWLLKTTSRIHRAVEEPTLASIADVLEAQRSFWRALGILVLLASAAIVVAATYPTWGL